MLLLELPVLDVGEKGKLGDNSFAFRYGRMRVCMWFGVVKIIANVSEAKVPSFVDMVLYDIVYLARSLGSSSHIHPGIDGKHFQERCT